MELVAPEWCLLPGLLAIPRCWRVLGVLGSPYWVMKAMQESTMMGMSALLSCWSLRALPRPPADAWMSLYHAAESARDRPCR